MLTAPILSSDSHVFEPPDLWQSRIDARFRERAPRIQRVDGVDHIVVERDKLLTGIGLLTNAGARFEAPETISLKAKFDDVERGGYDPNQHLADMRKDGVLGEVLYPSQGLAFYRGIDDPELLSATFRAYNDWIADFCKTDPTRLKGIAMINLDVVADGVKELERCAKLGLVGGMISEMPVESRLYANPDYDEFWAAAQALEMPISLHTFTRRQGQLVATARRRATKAFNPALSLSDMMFAGVFERFPKLIVAIVEFELSWAPYLITQMDFTYKERHEEATYRFKEGVLPSDLFHRNVVLSFQEDAIGIRLRDVLGVDNLMWGSDYPHSESTFPHSRKILGNILADVPADEQAKIVGGNTARVYRFDLARLVAEN